MKRIKLLLAVAFIALTANAQLLFNENFDYPAGSALIGQGGWAILLTSVINPITVTAASINYPGYYSSGIGQELS